MVCEVSKEFKERWNFRNWLGTLDDKHIHMKRSVDSGSYYFSYKETFNIVLLALVDAEFTYIDIDYNGRISDGDIYRNSFSTLENNSLNIVKERKVDNFMMLPFVIVRDGVFSMKLFLMKPYSKYILSINRVKNIRLLHKYG